jgi:hypothetical protein
VVSPEAAVSWSLLLVVASACGTTTV